LAAQNTDRTIKDIVSLACLALAAAFLVFGAVKLTAFAAASPAALDPSDPNASVESPPDPPARIQEVVAALKTKNMFVPPPPPPQPPKQVNGIFGKQALITGKWYAVGDTVPPGAKVLAIDPTCVKLLWKDKEITLAPIMAATSAKPAQPPPSSKKEPAQTQTPPPQIAPAPVRMERLRRFRPPGFPGGRRGGFRDRRNRMSPEEREQRRRDRRNNERR